MMDKLWKDWDLSDWLAAKYCPECGLPMFKLEEDELQNSYQEHKYEDGSYQCVYCTWIDDEPL
jgi:uncharacterized protein with PIN domain